jgi:hypothetical protein
VPTLSDVARDGHIWGDQFEGTIDSIFDIQDLVTTRVSAMIDPAISSIEIERAYLKPTDNLIAYDLFLRALRRYRHTPVEAEEALRLLYQAIELDPSYGAAYALAA